MVRTGPANYLSLLVHSARMEGFVLFDYIPEYPLGTRFAFAFVPFSFPHQGWVVMSDVKRFPLQPFASWASG